MTDVSSIPPAEGDDRGIMTNRQGHPVYDNQNQRTVGERGPATLENYQFLEKISQFDRERIPERVVHARGTTAFGYFEAYGSFGDEPISKYTRVSDFFSENEQIAFGTGVLVDGLDFSDDKMLVGRTFSYSDTQRYRVGLNYLQLPVNQPKAPVRTNQQGGQMSYGRDDVGANRHVNYEPSITGGLREAQYPTHDEQGPVIEGRLTRKRISRTQDYKQAGERNRLFEQWEKDDLVLNLVTLIGQCDRAIQERMVWHFLLCDDELGLRVATGWASGSTTSAASSRSRARRCRRRTSSGSPSSAPTARATSRVT